VKVDNLVFNRLGNSFSVMISSSNENVQIWDKVKFDSGKELYAVSTIPFSMEAKNVYFSCILKIKTQFYGIYFYNSENISFFTSSNIDDKKLFLPKKVDYEFEYNGDFFNLKIENAELIFKLSMSNPNFLKLENGNVFILEENFLKAVSELF